MAALPDCGKRARHDARADFTKAMNHGDGSDICLMPLSGSLGFRRKRCKSLDVLVFGKEVDGGTKGAYQRDIALLVLNVCDPRKKSGNKQ
jgi:hypothetical protein